MPYVEGTETYAALFPRQSGCVVCQEGTPSCPNCPDGEECQITVPLDCTQCAQAYCVASAPSSTSTANKSSHANTGAIAGAVVGGVALIVIVGVITFLVWKYRVKNKRQTLDPDAWDEDPDAIQREKEFAARRDQRASTHTVNSIASTVLTRASNIIQIAYIPGVTNRATPTSPTLLVPPVPPIPIAVSSSQASSPAPGEDQHFFVPGNLRDSTYSGVSGYTDRSSLARNSLGPRSSVASTIYGKSGVVLTPAQTGMRAKAAMVSVRSTGSGGSGPDGVTPPVPAVDKKYSQTGPPSPSGSTFSVGSTFLNNASANTATAVQARVVRVGSNLKKSITPSSASGDEEPAKAATPTTQEPPLNEQAPFRESNAVTLINDSPQVSQSPFSDPPKNKEDPKRKSDQSLSAVIEEATRRASERSSTTRGHSPFDDEHATKDQ